MGHFFRTLALAEMLKEEFNCIYATKNPNEFQVNEILKICSDYIVLPDNIDHFNTFLNYLTGNEIVVLDNYYFDTNYQINIKKKGCKLVCIDDLHDKHFVADVIINQAEGINPSLYSCEDYTKIYIGFDYALLRKSFLEIGETISKNKEFSFIIFMGAADPYNLTNSLFDLLINHEFNKPFILISKDNSFIKGTNNNKFVFFDNLSTNQLKEKMLLSEFGIFPSSTIAIEAIALRIPFICGYYINNQKEIYNGIKKNKLAVCVGNYLQITSSEFNKALEEISLPLSKQKIINNQKEVFDKKSPKRILEIFKKL